MGSSSLVKAACAAVLVLAPAVANADPVFNGSSAMPDFQLFPFWQKVLADMPGLAPLPAPTTLSPAAAVFPAPAAGIAQPTALVPAMLTTIPPMTVSRMATAPLIQDSGQPCADERHCIPKVWTDFLAGTRGLAPRAQLEAVNNWANAKPYVEDITNWGLPDYWETPGEFIAHGGDCEDYAIAKYFSLVRLGFAPDDLRIVIVSDSVAHDFHAVLVARIDDTDWLLDNQLSEVTALSAKPQYTPIYSLNQQGSWMHSSPVISLGAGLVIAVAPATPDTTSPVRLAAAN
jgi:predicted transglutaminase-like cysteine proteinase